MSNAKKDPEEVTVTNPLKPQEVEELRDAQAVYEMSKSSGWVIISKMLERMAYHSWVDPREGNRDEWEWKELNAFHAANNAKELLSGIQEIIEKAEYLDKVRSGELQRKVMRL